MSHHWHPASDSLVAGGRLALRASEALAASGAAPSVSNHDVIKKPNFASPYPPTHFVWHDPIKDRLQSSYEDVNFEVDWIRAHAMHKDSAAVMLGGDGLTYMRIAQEEKKKRWAGEDNEGPTSQTAEWYGSFSSTCGLSIQGSPTLPITPK